MGLSGKQERAVVRDYVEGDEEALSEITASFTGRLFGKEYWLSKLKRGPGGSALVKIAEADDKIVALVVAIPHTLSVRGTGVSAACVSHVLRLPGYEQRGGGWMNVAKAAQDEGSQRGINVFYGITNKLSKVASRALGFHTVGQISTLRRPLDARGYFEDKYGPGLLSRIPGIAANAALRLRFPVGKVALPDGWHLLEVERFDDRFDKLWNSISRDFGAATERNADYLNWRYRDPNGFDYTIIALEDNSDALQGFIVLRFDERGKRRRGHFVDIVASPTNQKAIKVLLDYGINFFRKERAAVIHCWVLDHTLLFTLLRRAGFLPGGEERHLVIKTADTEADHVNFLRQIENWFVTKADYELL